MKPPAACFDTLTPVLNADLVKKAKGVFFDKRHGISYYQIKEPIGPYPAGYIVGLLVSGGG